MSDGTVPTTVVRHRILPNKKIGQRLARFRQVNMDNPVAHHDALEFPDGQVVLGRVLINPAL